MRQQVVVIHGGHAYDSYEEYLQELREKKVGLARLSFGGWKHTLGQKLGSDFEVLALSMPNPQNATYLEWKIWFEKYIPLLNEEVILVGHSLGGIFLAKYLGEEQYPRRITATFLVAAPYNTLEDHPLADFILSISLEQLARQGGEIFLYHSKDDEVVPFSNFERYQKELPSAHARIFTDRGHFHAEELPEILADIRACI